MENETLKQRIDHMETNLKGFRTDFQKDVEDLRKKIDDMPDRIAQRLEETASLRTELAIKNLENRFFKYIIGLTIAIISEMIMIIFNYIR